MRQNGGSCSLPVRETEWLRVGVEMGVGVDEGDFFGGGGNGEKMLFLGGAVPEAGSEDLHNIAVGGPAGLVAALELEGAGADADDVAVEVDHGAVGEGVDLDGAVAVVGLDLAYDGLYVRAGLRGSLRACAAAERKAGEDEEGFHSS